MEPGEVVKFTCRSQLREFTTTSMERGHDPPEDGFPGKEGSAQSLSVAMKQRLAPDDASQGTSETAQQDSRQAEIEPDDRGRAIPQELSCGTVVAGGNPGRAGSRPFYKPEEFSFGFGLPRVAPVQLIELDMGVAPGLGVRAGERGLACAAGADHNDSVRGGGVDRHGRALCTAARCLALPSGCRPHTTSAEAVRDVTPNQSVANGRSWPTEDKHSSYGVTKTSSSKSKPSSLIAICNSAERVMVAVADVPT